jgi:molecular chaperone DnaK
MTALIPRNTTIPTRRDETFSTAEDNQGKVEIHVLQGERAEARHNRTLGRFHLEGIMPAPRGVPKIKVTFDLDANGILSVMAKDEATGKDQKITITSNSGLEDAEIERMVTEAQEHEEDDKKRRESVESRNRADQLCYSVEKSLSEIEDKVDAQKIADVKVKVEELRKAIDEQNDALITERTSALEKAMQAIATEAYQAAGGDAGAAAAAGAAGAAGAPPSDEKDDGVIDAEFEDAN